MKRAAASILGSLVKLLLLLLPLSANAAVYKVGDSAGWTTIGNVDYKKWAATKTFSLSDVIGITLNNPLLFFGLKSQFILLCMQLIFNWFWIIWMVLILTQSWSCMHGFYLYFAKNNLGVESIFWGFLPCEWSIVWLFFVDCFLFMGSLHLINFCRHFSDICKD